MTSNPSTRSDAQANRQKLVQAARAVFRERGPGADIKEIADRAGVGVGTVYRNFATKDDLLTAIVQSVMSEIQERLADTYDLSAPAASIAAMLRVALSYAESEGPLLLALKDAAPVGAFEGDPRPLLRQALEHGVTIGVFRSDIPVAILSAYFEAHFPLYLDLRASFTQEQASAAIVSLVLSAIQGPRGHA